jgi:hypothetical protein
MPLAVGNKWIYDYSWWSDSVTASVVIDGKKYFTMRGTSLAVAGMPTNVRLNAQNQFLVRREIAPYGEYVLFDFGAEVGSEWQFLGPRADTSYSGTVTLISRSDSASVPAGEFRGCYLFHYKSARWTDSDYGWLIAPNKGIVHFGGGLGHDVKLVEFIQKEG